MPVPAAPTPAHYTTLASICSSGNFVFFLGAGVNYAQRQGGSKNYLPTGAELAVKLAQDYGFPDTQTVLNWKTQWQTVKGKLQAAIAAQDWSIVEQAADLASKLVFPDLARVSQFADTMRPPTATALQEALHNLFSQRYEPTDLHEVLAHIPSLVTTVNRKPIFITTNYDTVLEHALAERNEPFDVVYYREPPNADVPCYRHWKNAHKHFRGEEKSFSSTHTEITPLQSYADLPLGADEPLRPASDPKCARVVIVKIHGTVAPDAFDESGFVITSDHYVNFLRRVEVSNPLPKFLASRMIHCHFLFLGYGLQDVNILVICQNLWGQRTKKTLNNWAVKVNATEFDEKYWASEEHGKVTMFNCDLTAYAQALRAALPPDPLVAPPTPIS